MVTDYATNVTVVAYGSVVVAALLSVVVVAVLNVLDNRSR